MTVTLSTERHLSDAAPTLTREQARALTDRIKEAIEGVWDLVAEAYETRAWQVLGYAHWNAYHEAEFGDLKIRPSRLDRPLVVQALRERGLPIRAIATATGASVGTVHGDLEDAAVVQKRTTAASQQVTGRDGKEYRATVTVDGVAGEFSKAVAAELEKLPERRRARCVKEVTDEHGQVTAVKVRTWRLEPTSRPAPTTQSHRPGAAVPAEIVEDAADEPQVSDDVIEHAVPTPAWLGDYPQDMQDAVRRHVRTFIEQYGIGYARAFEYGLTEAIFG